MPRRTTFSLFILALSFLVILDCGCDKTAPQDVKKKKELLIYCGITMIHPMSAIAEIIEKQEDCKISITKGGSGNLLKSIKINNVGDMYLPGSDSYIKTCLNEGIVTESVFVGYNKAAMMVQKGNPKKISTNLANLADKKYYVVIGNPNSGSIGKETKRILGKKGIYEQVMDNARRLTTDSKDLVHVLQNKEADLVVNWHATSTWPENRPYVDAISINEEYAPRKRLVIGLLKTSRHPDIARKFMQYAVSDKGKELFEKYGFLNVI